MKRSPLRLFTQRARRVPQTGALTTQGFHAAFVTRLGDRQLQRYTDGGPSDLNRSRKRAAGKRQRQARARQRRAAR